jgi:hypothetical protein
MDKLEYGDLYRFYVSLGLALIAGAIGAMWLFLKEPFDLGRTVEQIQKLTPIAQEVIAHRQHWTALILRILPRAAVVVMLMGAVSMVYGLVRWRPSQTLLDRRRLAETLKVERDAQPMDATEIFAKGKANVAIQLASSGAPLNRTTLQSQSLDAEVVNYLQLENELLDTLAERLSANFRLLRQQRIGTFTFDAIIRSLTPSGRNYILEFKALAPGSNVQTLDDALRKAARAADWLGAYGYGRHIPLVVAVSADLNPTFIESAQRMMNKYADNPTAFGSALLRLMPQERVRTLSARDSDRLLDPKERCAVLGEPAAAP